MEKHIDNLQYGPLTAPEVQSEIEKEVLQPTKGACKECYQQSLESLTKDDIAYLLVENYAKNGKFLPYGSIEKNYTYALLVQTGLAMLGYDIDINAQYSSSTKRIVQQFEKDN